MLRVCGVLLLLAIGAEAREARPLIVSNALSFGSTVLMAQAVKYGVRACIGEGEKFRDQGGILPRNMYQPRVYAIGLSADAVALGLSVLFHKHRKQRLEVLAPLMNASVQAATAGFNYSAGCF